MEVGSGRAHPLAFGRSGCEWAACRRLRHGGRQGDAARVGAGTGLVARPKCRAAEYCHRPQDRPRIARGCCRRGAAGTRPDRAQRRRVRLERWWSFLDDVVPASSGADVRWLAVRSGGCIGGNRRNRAPIHRVRGRPVCEKTDDGSGGRSRRCPVPPVAGPVDGRREGTRRCVDAGRGYAVGERLPLRRPAHACSGHVAGKPTPWTCLRRMEHLRRACSFAVPRGRLVRDGRAWRFRPRATCSRPGSSGAAMSC